MNERNWPEIVKRMIDGGWTTTQIGFKSGVSAQAVNLYRLGKVTPSRAVQMLMERDKDLKGFVY